MGPSKAWVRFLYRSSVAAFAVLVLLVALMTAKTLWLGCCGETSTGQVVRSGHGWEVRFDTDGVDERAFGLDSLPGRTGHGDTVGVRYADAAWVQPEVEGTPWWHAWPFLVFSAVPLVSAIAYRSVLRSRGEDERTSRSRVGSRGA
ncbi:hypothetical protein [Thalassiella azotivora]